VRFWFLDTASELGAEASNVKD